MKFQKAKLDGVWLIEFEKKEDERGFFARTWCREEFEAHGLNPGISQASLAYNEKKSTLRGMHFQKAPYAETKTLFCCRGAIYDVVIDLRPGSKTFCQWMTVTLSEEKPQSLYIPEGFAHGFQTLTDQTQIFYQISVPYEPSAASGVRWDDPVFKIRWPETPERIISVKDQSWPNFEHGKETLRSYDHASL